MKTDTSGPIGTTDKCVGQSLRLHCNISWDGLLHTWSCSTPAASMPYGAEFRATLTQCVGRATLDEDVPAFGKNYCATCSRYFVTPGAQAAHNKTKAHKRRSARLWHSAGNTVCTPPA